MTALSAPLMKSTSVLSSNSCKRSMIRAIFILASLAVITVMVANAFILKRSWKTVFVRSISPSRNLSVKRTIFSVCQDTCRGCMNISLPILTLSVLSVIVLKFLPCLSLALWKICAFRVPRHGSHGVLSCLLTATMSAMSGLMRLSTISAHSAGQEARISSAIGLANTWWPRIF